MDTPVTPHMDALNAAHAIPDQLAFIAGPGGLPLIEVHNAHARAQVSLHGGQVLSFRPHTASADLLFVSERARYQAGAAIRGGVPVCWPWFGPDPEGLGRPNHGFARTKAWSVAGTTALPGGATRIALALTDGPDTRAIWPHPFRLELEITVGPSLRLVLLTRNTGDQPFTLTQALHSYLAVGELAQTAVAGLDGRGYIDKAAGAPGALRKQLGAVVFTAEVDRIYTGAPATLSVQDGTGQRVLRIRSEGSRSAVVWNPGAALAAGMADLADEEYRRFVCVETANVADDAVTLPPGGEHRLVADIGWQGEPG